MEAMRGRVLVVVRVESKSRKRRGRRGGILRGGVGVLFLFLVLVVVLGGGGFLFV